MNPPSSFYNDFKAELVFLGAWVSELASQGTEEAKDELLAELIQVCISSREDRVRVYEKFVSEGLICPFEMLILFKLASKPFIFKKLAALVLVVRLVRNS